MTRVCDWQLLACRTQRGEPRGTVWRPGIGSQSVSARHTVDYIPFRSGTSSRLFFLESS